MSSWLTRLLGGSARGHAAVFEGKSVVATSTNGDDSHGDAEFAEGVRLFAEQRYPQARAMFRAVIDHRHDFAAAHNFLGLCAFKLEDYEDAADCFAMAALFMPGFYDAHYNRALTLSRLAMPRAAIESLEQAIALAPNAASALNLRGVCLLALGEVKEATGAFQHAVDNDPALAIAQSNLGYVLLRDAGDYDRGIRHIERALELDPGNTDALCNYTMVLSHRGEHEQAIAMCDRLLQGSPDLHEARLNRALALLMLGRFDTAWDDYEARKLVRCNFVPRQFPAPEWQQGSFLGATLLVYGEQGLGDEIMFASCFGDLFERFGTCVIECASPLAALFRRSFPRAKVFAGKQQTALPAWLDQAPRIDFQTAAGSLPRHFRCNRDAFPSRSDGYLKADAARIAFWCDRLDALGPGLKVGISWRGGTPSTRTALRSIGAREWPPVLAQSGCHFVSLQYGNVADEVADFERIAGVTLNCWPEAIADLDETAALICALDLVVSVCTAVVHLAGALGRPVWVLVPTIPEWRYMAQGQTMPWYPTARLFRQSVPEDWGSVLRDVVNALRSLRLAPARPMS